MDGENKIQTEYEEINLMDYIRVVIKRKRMIFGVFLAVVIAAAVYSFFICPKIYKVDTLIEIGKIEGSSIEELPQVIEKLDNDVYGIPVREKLKIPVAQFPKIKTKNPLGTRLLTIQIESSQPEFAKEILGETNNLIIADHQNEIKVKKGLVEKNIERLKNKVSLLEEEKKNLEKKEKSLEWLSPYEKISEQLTGSLFLFLDLREKLSAKSQEIENLYMQINSLQASLDDIKPTQIVKTPTISNGSVSPRPVLNIVIATALGIFLGTFLAFSKEWWEKNKI